MGVLTPRLHTLDGVTCPPINTINFRKYPHIFLPTNCTVWGEWGFPDFFRSGILFLCYLEAHAKFQNPTCLLFGRKVKALEEEERKKEEEKITQLITATSLALLRGSARTPLRPKVKNVWVP